MGSDPQPHSADQPVGTDPPVGTDQPIGTHSSEPGQAKRRRIFTVPSILFVLLSGLLAYVAVAVLPQVTGPGNSPETVISQPTPTAFATPTPPPAPISTAISAAPVPAGPAASPPQRLSYPAADIDVAVHPLEPTGADQASQTIVPPPTMDGYWLTPYGVPGAGSQNTTYVAGHSWVDRDAPFNHLSTKAAVGDKLTVATATGVLSYRVDSVATYEKSSLKDSPIWQVAPNRLVLISCYAEDFWGTNVVVVASPDPEVPLR